MTSKAGLPGPAAQGRSRLNTTSVLAIPPLPFKGNTLQKQTHRLSFCGNLATKFVSCFYQPVNAHGLCQNHTKILLAYTYILGSILLLDFCSFVSFACFFKFFFSLFDLSFQFYSYRKEIFSLKEVRYSELIPKS